MSSLKYVIRLFVLFVVCCGPVHCLKLKRVIVSTDDNPLYVEFWPAVAKAWTAMGLRPTLVLISYSDCVDTRLGDVVRFDPIPGVPTAMQAQVYRLFLPALFPDEGCIISDMDMVPISKEYFVENAKSCLNHSFLIYRDAALPKQRQYPMCYVAAKGKLFGSIFRIANRQDFADRLEECRSLFDQWETDQLVLFRWVNEWQARGGSVVKLGHKVKHRLDRADWKYHWSSKELHSAIDAHCPRPYSLYKDSIDSIVDEVVKKYKR
jgi:hypothetical protein